jgi:hypothetical protein
MSLSITARSSDIAGLPCSSFPPGDDAADHNDWGYLQGGAKTKENIETRRPPAAFKKANIRGMQLGSGRKLLLGEPRCNSRFAKRFAYHAGYDTPAAAARATDSCLWRVEVNHAGAAITRGKRFLLAAGRWIMKAACSDISAGWKCRKPETDAECRASCINHPPRIPQSSVLSPVSAA